MAASADPASTASATVESRERPHGEETGAEVHGRLNWLRAGVLGANDGIVSVAGIVVGVAGATSDRTTIATAGIAGLVAGALSMATGEYVSVSTQRDTEQALIEKERAELATMPDQELAELGQLYERKGLSAALAHEVAQELTAKDALGAHLDIELGIDPTALANPWQASIASAVSFTAGALLPLLAILLSPAHARVVPVFAVVVAALVLTGWVSARLGDAKGGRAVWRNVAGGLLAMAVTYGVGSAVGGLAL